MEANRHLNERNNNKKLLWKEIEKGSSPPPPKEMNGTTLERVVFIWVKQGISGKDPSPQLLPRKGPEQP